jgi:hypothetical protein
VHFREKLVALLVETHGSPPEATRGRCKADPKPIDSRMEQFIVN